MYRYGVALAFGIGCTRNSKTALEWLHSAADKGHAKANLVRAYLLRNLPSRNTMSDFSRSSKWIKQAIDAGCIEAMVYESIGMKGTNAYYLARKAANSGNVLACCIAGKYAFLGANGIFDPETAFFYFQKAAQKINSENYGEKETAMDAALITARMLLWGIGTKQDSQKAFQLFEELSNNGYVKAKLYLGVLYALGQGTAPDMTLAEKLLREYVQPPEGVKFVQRKIVPAAPAQRAENRQPKMPLSRRYSPPPSSKTPPVVASAKSVTGNQSAGIPSRSNPSATMQEMKPTLTSEQLSKDPKVNSQFLKILKIAEQGNAKAQYNVFFMYSRGNGVPRNNEEAMRWCYQAASNGYPIAQFSLGLTYERRKNLDEAVKWYQKAAAAGYKPAKTRLKQIKR